MEMYEAIRDPEKNPTPEDLETLKPHPSLIQALEALQPAIDPQLEEGDDDIEIQLELKEEAFTAIDDEQDSDQGENIPSDDDDDEDSIASFDSIARNADFVSLRF